MTTTTKKIEIALSERAPIRIVEEDWPVIAESVRWNGEHRFQSFDENWIRVREHDDGRRIVYGFNGDGQGGSRLGRREVQAGFLVGPREPRDAGMRDPGMGKPLGRHPDDDETIRAIRRVAGVIGDSLMADEVIAELPPEELV